MSERLPTAGLGPDTARRYKPGHKVRHSATGIRGRIIGPWRFFDRDSGADGRDWVRVRWPGGIVTDEPPAELVPYAS